MAAMSMGWAVPGYTEIRDLGTGSQGRVALARNDHDGSVVAIKYLPPELMASPEKALFRQEALTLVQVDDEHIARLHHYFENRRGAAIVMEAVDGVTLRTLLTHNGALTPEAALVVLKGSLLGLAAAHAVRVVHGDYKPANVLVQGNGQSKLIDFGIAVLSGRGTSAGTPAYMAPEQWKGAPASPATDVYAATCVFCECVTGHQPYGDDTTGPIRNGPLAWGLKKNRTIREQHLNAHVPVRDIPRSLRPLVRQGMAKRAADRPDSARTFVAVLETTAVNTYGPDWERRGFKTLAAVAGIFTAALPVAVLAATKSTAITAVERTAEHAIRHAHPHRALSKVAHSKITAAVTGTTAVGAVAALLLWPPTGPTIGGTNSGEYQMSFQRPSVLLDNPAIPDGSQATPSFTQTYQLTPARVRPGTTMHLTVKWLRIVPWGLQYLSEGKYRCHETLAHARSHGQGDHADTYHRGWGFQLGGNNNNAYIPGRLWLFPGNVNTAQHLPTQPGTPITATMNRQDGPFNYDWTQCAFYYYTTITYTFKTLTTTRPGQYTVSIYNTPGTTTIYATVKGKYSTVTPAAVGEKTQGSIPEFTVLAH